MTNAGSRGLALLLLGLAACPRSGGVPDAGPAVPPGPPQVGEVEPNDDLAHAQPLTRDCLVSGTIHASTAKRSDEDWYRVEVPASGQRTTVSLDPVPGLALDLQVLDSDQVKRLELDAPPPGGSEIVRNLPSAHAWFIGVTPRQADAIGAYQLTLHTEPDDGSQELEPNNRAADATPLAMGKPVQGWLSDPGDEDWFHLALPDAGQPLDGGAPDAGPPDAGPLDGGADAGQLSLDAGAPADAGLDAGSLAPVAPLALVHLAVTGIPNVRIEASVVNAAGVPVIELRGRGPGDGVEVRNLALRGPDTDFYVVVKPAYVAAGKELKRGYSMDTPYAVTASLETGKGSIELEPNDDAAHATPVDVSSGSAIVEGYLSSKTDIDLYRLHADKPVLARIDLSAVEHVDLELAVVRPGKDGKDEVLLSANDGELKEPETLTNVALGPGDTLVKVEGAARKNAEGHWSRDTFNAQKPYRLSVATQPDDPNIEHEPNNQPDTATPIAIGQMMRGTIHPKRDVDFYRLDLRSQPVKLDLQVTCSGVAKVDVALYLLRLGADGQTTLVQTSDSAKGDAPEVIHYAAEPGVYLIKVQDLKNRESNFLDYYSLRVESE